MITSHIRTRIIQLRKQKGFTQQSLADEIGMDVRTLQRLEKGEKKTVDPDVIERIAGVLGETVESFFASGQDELSGNRPATFTAVIEEIREHCTHIIQHYRHALEEERRSSAEKDLVIRDYREQVERLREGGGRRERVANDRLRIDKCPGYVVGINMAHFCAWSSEEQSHSRALSSCSIRFLSHVFRGTTDSRKCHSTENKNHSPNWRRPRPAHRSTSESRGSTKWESDSLGGGDCEED